MIELASTISTMTETVSSHGSKRKTQQLPGIGYTFTSGSTAMNTYEKAGKKLNAPERILKLYNGMIL